MSGGSMSGKYKKLQDRNKKAASRQESSFLAIKFDYLRNVYLK
jgi:hypothetical protein